MTPKGAVLAILLPLAAQASAVAQVRFAPSGLAPAGPAAPARVQTPRSPGSGTGPLAPLAGLGLGLPSLPGMAFSPFHTFGPAADGNAALPRDAYPARSSLRPSRTLPSLPDELTPPGLPGLALLEPGRRKAAPETGKTHVAGKAVPAGELEAPAARSWTRGLAEAVSALGPASSPAWELRAALDRLYHELLLQRPEAGDRQAGGSDATGPEARPSARRLAAGPGGARPGSPAGDARTERFRTGPFGRAADAESAFERPRALGSAGGENASALLEAGSGRASRERSLAAPAAAFARTGTRSAPRPLRLGPPFADDSAPSAALGLRIVEGSHRLGLDAEQAQDAAGLPGRSRLANQAGDAPDRVLGGRGAPPRPRRRGDGRRLALWTAAAASRVLVARSEAY